MGNSSKRDTRAAGQAEQQRKALELRKAGATYDQIADQLGLANRSVAWKLVKTAIDEITREAAEEVLALELARLDSMLLGLWTKAKAGDPAAVDRALRIMDRRASFLGLDAPKRNEVSGASGGPMVFTFSESFPDEQLRALAADDPREPGGVETGGSGRTGEAGEED
jgi:hypothetical protein